MPANIIDKNNRAFSLYKKLPDNRLQPSDHCSIKPVRKTSIVLCPIIDETPGVT
jgi:hypothetical protein